MVRKPAKAARVVVRRKRPDPEILQQAVLDSARMGARKAARKHDISHQSVLRAIGRAEASAAALGDGKVPFVGRTHNLKYVLSWEEEQQLVDYIVRLARANMCQTEKQLSVDVMKCVEDVGRDHPLHACAEKWKKNGRPSSKWWRGFLDRHPQLARRWGDPRGQKRMLVCKEDYDSLYDITLKDYIEQYEEKHGVPWDPKRLTNIDETNFKAQRQGKILTIKGSNYTKCVGNDYRGTLTLVCAIRADGAFYPPTIIGKGKYGPRACPTWWPNLKERLAGDAMNCRRLPPCVLAAHAALHPCWPDAPPCCPSHPCRPVPHANVPTC